MTSTEQGGMSESTSRIIESAREAEVSALGAVRKFLEAVDSVFPDVGDDRPRRKVIDSAFEMAEQLAGSWNQVADKVLKATSDALAQAKTATRSPSSGPHPPPGD